MESLSFLLAINCVIFGILGTSATCLIIYLIWKKRWKQLHLDLKLVLLALIINLLGSLGIIFLGIGSLLKTDIWTKYPILCNINSFFLIGFFYSSNYLVSLMSLQRFLSTAYSYKINFKLWLTLSIVIILTCCLLISIGIGLKLVELMPLKIYCMINMNKKMGYWLMACFFVFSFCSWFTIVFCYIGIVYFCWKKDIELRRDLNLDDQGAKKRMNKLLVRSLIIVTLYIIGNTVEVVNMSYELATGKSRGLEMDFISCSLLNLNLVTNSLLVLSLNSHIKSDFIRIFKFNE